MIVLGMANNAVYCQTFDIHTQTSYPTNPQVDMTQGPSSVAVIVETSGAVVFVSFDGTNDAGRINSDVLASITWNDYPGHRVWLKVANDPGTSINVTVQGVG